MTEKQTPSCWTCGKEKCTNVCGKCQTTPYCDVKCQTLDWEVGGHQYFCGRNMQGKIHKVMREFHKGKLHNGHGGIVTDKDQALAIAYSEARRRKH